MNQQQIALVNYLADIDRPFRDVVTTALWGLIGKRYENYDETDIASANNLAVAMVDEQKGIETMTEIKITPNVRDALTGLTTCIETPTHIAGDLVRVRIGTNYDEAIISRIVRDEDGKLSYHVASKYHGVFWVRGDKLEAAHYD